MGFFDILSEGSATEVFTEEDHDSVQARSNEEIDGMNRNGLQSTVTTKAEAEVDKETERTIEETENVGSESEAPISERAASGFSDSPTIGSPRVQFEKIKEEDASGMQTPEVPMDTLSGHEEDRNRRRHQKHEHK